MRVTFRDASEGDLPALVAMLADDDLGAGREDTSAPLNPAYLDAFLAIDRSPDQLIIVADTEAGIVGSYQLSFLPGLAYQGAWRGQIESVRVARPYRGQGYGSQMIEHALPLCRARGCKILQLSAHLDRTDAHRFYERIGFIRTHASFKLAL
ncbi:GNAT superfamily N-acetyltransferase [Rubricella aquisinus]|uniref:GNAT superfamily N-acetyltransferase n=1 Tax=Rubricella aquisinus TaxID=2028108 RepID=A0A840X1U3_9RHOB|nr:GNAT family N-acetyltransferase [Rubricella aquisinus]MBB5514637.1 GNAT superfamily N-acetyltransferase [Rubricella aquisinus]